MQEHIGRVIEKSEDIFICIYCSNHFASRYFLLKHQVTHLNSGLTNLPVCNICKKQFINLEFLVRHKVKAHVSSKLFPSCKKCGQSFLSRDSVECHLASASECNEGKLYVCETCSLTFDHPHFLERHKAVEHSNNSKVALGLRKEEPTRPLKSLMTLKLKE